MARSCSSTRTSRMWCGAQCMGCAADRADAHESLLYVITCCIAPMQPGRHTVHSSCILMYDSLVFSVCGMKTSDLIAVALRPWVFVASSEHVMVQTDAAVGSLERCGEPWLWTSPLCALVCSVGPLKQYWVKNHFPSCVLAPCYPLSIEVAGPVSVGHSNQE